MRAFSSPIPQNLFSLLASLACYCIPCGCCEINHASKRRHMMQHAFFYSWSINPSSHNASKCVTCFSVMEPQAPPAGYAWWWKRKKKKKQGKWIWHQTLIDVLVLVLVLLILMLLILLGHPSLPSRSDPLVFLRSSEVGFLLLSCFLCAFFVQKNREITKWAEVEVVASAFNLLSPYFSVAQNTRVERKERKVQLCVALI